MKRFAINNWPILLLLLSFSLIIWPLFLPGYFFHHDDLQIMRVFEMRKCFDDLQIPCRWVPDMGYGNGFPLYNYYSALPYYIGGLFSYLTTFIYSAKLLFLIPLLVGGLGMYLLVNSIYGKYAALTTAILFSFAPFRALDIYVRGAVAESWGLAIVPFVFFFSHRLTKNQNSSNFLGTSIFLGAFLLCHNIMTMFFSPLIFLWMTFWFFRARPKNIIHIVLSLICGFGLAAFFIMPAFLEKNLVQIESLKNGGSDFRAHFVSLNQLFLDRFWGYGASFFGPGDTISFQIGWPQWWVVAALLVPLSMSIFNFKSSFFKKVERNDLIIAIFFLVIFIISIFMMLNRSVVIWEHLSLLQFAQFPWRFLAVSIFSASLLGGLFIYTLQKKWQVIFSTVIIVLTITLNWSFFKPADFYTWMTDKDKLTGDRWNVQQQAGIWDYLPVTAREPSVAASNHPEVTLGDVEFSNFINRSNHFSFKAQVFQTSDIEVPVFDFPVWKVHVNSQFFQHSHNNSLGRIGLSLPPGEYLIEGKFTDTPIRTIANSISILSLIGIIIFTVYDKKQFNKSR